MKNETLKLFITLLLMALVAGLCLSGVYAITRKPIEEQTAAAAVAARQAALPAAVSFEQSEYGGEIPVFRGMDAQGVTVGYVTTCAATGFGGEIEVTVGMDMNGKITAIFVGGENFAETPGFGAKVQDSAFTNQFMGKGADDKLDVTKDGGDIDAVSGATRSSRAVSVAVKAAYALLTAAAKFGG